MNQEQQSRALELLRKARAESETVEYSKSHSKMPGAVFHIAVLSDGLCDEIDDFLEVLSPDENTPTPVASA